MRKWFAIVGVGAVVGYAAVYFALGGSPEPEAEQPSAAAPQPAGPVVLPNVVEVTSLEPLLDPQPAQPGGGVPFDPTEPLEPAVRADAPAKPAIAPMPRPVG